MANLFHCEQCGHPVTTDDVCFDGENNLCPACVDRWRQEELDNHFASYQAAKHYGLLTEPTEEQKREWRRLKGME